MSRWAYYSKPRRSESLSQWLRRVAKDFGFPTGQALLAHLDLEPIENLALDFACPPEIIERLASLTALSVKKLASLTCEGIDADTPYSTFERKIVRYLWAPTPRLLSFRMNAMSKSPCERTIIKPLLSREYNNVQRELARSELLLAQAGTIFQVYNFISFATRGEDIIHSVERCLSRDVHLSFFKENITFSNLGDLDALRKAVSVANAYRYPERPEKVPDPRRIHATGRTPAMSVESKIEATALYVDGAASVNELCLRFGTSKSAMYRAIAEYRLDDGAIKRNRASAALPAT